MTHFIEIVFSNLKILISPKEHVVNFLLFLNVRFLGALTINADFNLVFLAAHKTASLYNNSLFISGVIIKNTSFHFK